MAKAKKTTKKAKKTAAKAGKGRQGTKVRRIHEARPAKKRKMTAKEIRERQRAKKDADKPLIQPRKDYADALDDAADENAKKNDAEIQELDDAIEMGAGGVRPVKRDE